MITCIAHVRDEDLATHKSGLPEYSDNCCPFFDPAKEAVQDSIQSRCGIEIAINIT